MEIRPISAPKRIAVIGGGISGMGAAYLLSSSHRVTLFEAEPRLGGHARTVLAGRNGDQPVDTGFIVFNYATYPHLTALFDKLNVPVTKSDMSFGASIDGGRLEYGLRNLNAIFAQRRNLGNPKFLGMIRDVLRFGRRARAVTGGPGQSIGDFLSNLGTGDWFREYYLLPLSGAIWSTPAERIMDFPADALVQFFENHALLSPTHKHQWYTVKGGSVEYVRRLEATMQSQGVDIRLGAQVSGVRRGAQTGVKIVGADWESFDEIVFATHSDDTLALLTDPSPEETATLGAITYQPNEAVLHADETMMPKRRAVWSSWNYAEALGKRGDKIDLTYWMNSLQPIPKEDPLFVTLNSTRPIREELIYDQVTFRHPFYDLAALQAQEKVRAMNGAQNTWLCGAWLRNGFHEDGLGSAHDMFDAMMRRDSMVQAA